jgi:hypothetical protein
MLAPSRNTTEQRYQTNALGLESNPGSPFSLWKHPLTRQQESKSSLWTSKNDSQLTKRAGEAGYSAPLSPLLPGKPERCVFSLDSMDLSSGATTAKDAAKDTKEQAVQAFISSGPSWQAEDVSEPIRSALSSRTVRRRLRASKASPDASSSLAASLCLDSDNLDSKKEQLTRLATHALATNGESPLRQPTAHHDGSIR